MPRSTLYPSLSLPKKLNTSIILNKKTVVSDVNNNLLANRLLNNETV